MERGAAAARWIGSALLCLMIPAAGRAEPGHSGAFRLPTDPVLAKLIKQSLAARPEVAQAAEVARAERERVPQAGALPDPMLQLGVQNDSFTSWEVGKMETSWYSIIASQTFPWPGKLGLRKEIAQLGASQAAESVARLRLSTEAEVRRAYLALMLARDRLALIDRLESLSRTSTSVAQAQYEAGTGAQSDILRGQLEVRRIQQRRWALQVEANTAVQALNRLRGHPLGEPIEPAIRLVDLALPTLPAANASYQDALTRSPELASARARLTQGQRSVALARRDYIPDLTVNFGIMPRGGDLSTMWLASVGIPLPVYAPWKQSRAVAESERRALADQRNVQTLEQVVRLRVDQRRTALAATLETIRIYREGLLAESEATAQSTVAQYEVAKVGFLSVIEANTGLIADQDSLLQLLAEAQGLQIEAAEVSLGPPVGFPEAGGGAFSGPGAAPMERGAPSPGPPVPASAQSSTAAGM